MFMMSSGIASSLPDVTSVGILSVCLDTPFQNLRVQSSTK